MSNYEDVTHDSDRPLTLLGVPGRLTHRTIAHGKTKPGCWEHQRWLSEARHANDYEPGAMIRAEIRFDDDCGNGHNTFAITADVFKVRNGKRRDIAGGCCHEEIAKAFPELAPLIVWHLTSTDGPMHYAANTVYLAGDRDYNGRAAGEPASFSYGVRFDSVPVTHRLAKPFYDFIIGRAGSGAFQVYAMAHEDRPGESYKFGPKYSLIGYAGKWHECPFDDKTEADEFCAALNTCALTFAEVPTSFSTGKARELNAARSAAAWPDATDAQLSVPRDELRAALAARLPALLAAFRSDMERCGFYWSPADYRASIQTVQS